MASLKKYLPNPEIQREYEQLLSKFLMAFNRVEGVLIDFLEHVCTESGNNELWCKLKTDDLSRRIKNLKLVSIHMKEFPNIPFDKIEILATIRNGYAHGNYWQSRRNGKAFTLRTRNGTKKITIGSMRGHVVEVETLASELENEIWQFLYP